MSDGSWADDGFEGLPEAEKEYEKRMSNDIQRFWLKPGTTKEIVFETDQPICFWEHQLNLNGSWLNWFTCRSKLEGGCPICESGDNASYVGIFLARDMTGYTSKKSGKQVGIGRRIFFVAKKKTLTQIKTLKERREGGLVGLRFAVTRSDENSASCGDLFDSVGKEDLAGLPDVGEKPDLMEVFKPLSREEIIKRLGGGPMASAPPEEDDVPF